MRDLVALSAVDVVYVHAPDRLARSYAHQVLLLEEFSRAGTQAVFLNRPIGDTPEDSLLLQLQGMFAEYERAKMLERSRRGSATGPRAVPSASSPARLSATAMSRVRRAEGPPGMRSMRTQPGLSVRSSAGSGTSA